jgi:hypothetical protein
MEASRCGRHPVTGLQVFAKWPAGLYLGNIKNTGPVPPGVSLPSKISDRHSSIRGSVVALCHKQESRGFDFR